MRLVVVRLIMGLAVVGWGGTAGAAHTLDVLVDGEGSAGVGGAVMVDPLQAEYDHGSAVTLTAAPTPGWQFSHWTVEEIPETQKASNPSPSHEAEQVALASTLQWTPGAGADSQELYFGSGTFEPPLVASYGANVTSHNPGSLKAATWYYWRVDEIGASETIQGDLWSFKTKSTPSCDQWWAAATAAPSGPTGLAFAPLVFCLVTCVTWAAFRGMGRALSRGAVACLVGAILALGTAYAVQTENPLSLTMDVSYRVTAHFVRIEYGIATAVSGTGTVAVDPDSGPYHYGDGVTLTATPQPGWQFDNWSGSATGSQNPIDLTIQTDIDVTAHFSEVSLPEVQLNISTAGSGAVAQDPLPPYTQGQQVTLTATAAEGYTFSGWSGDLDWSGTPVTITLDQSMDITATFVEVSGHTFTVNIVGQGTYELDPPPPYTETTTVTVTFFPSPGQQHVTKPDVPPAYSGSPYAGWCFSHWTWLATPASTLGVQFRGLDNPATFEVDQDLTIYAHFLNNGTTCHPTANQEAQLMDIARGNWSGFDGLTAEQVAQMYVKAEGWNDVIRDKHLKWGQLVTGWFREFERETYQLYDYLGEGMTWSGMYLASLALKSNAMPGDQQTINDLNVLLDAMDRNTTIQGVDGYVSRFSGPTSDSTYQAYYLPYGPGYGSGVAPYENYTWLASPTRDSHTGLFVGLAAVLAHCQDASTVEKAKVIAERVVDRLIQDSFWIKDARGSEVSPLPNLTQLQKRVAYKANPTKYSVFQTDIGGFEDLSFSTTSLYASEYWENWLSWAQMWGIATLEENPSRLADYKEDFETAYQGVTTHMNTLYAAVTTSFASPTLGDIVFATHQGNLLCAPDGVKWTWEVDLTADPRFTVRDSTYVTEAALPHQRFHVDFSPQRSAAKAKGGFNHFAYCHTNFDLIWAYWTGRVSGAIPAP